MAWPVEIHDWPTELVPTDQVLRAGGEVGGVLVTLGGVSITNPEPGGRYDLTLRFPDLFMRRPAALAASWAFSRLMGGAVMRIQMCSSVQTVPAADLGGNAAATVAVTADAGRGAAEVSFDMGAFGEVVERGHVIGWSDGTYDFAHIVLSVTYDGADVATAKIAPPLRRAITTSDVIGFRPTVLVQCQNARAVMGGLQNRSWAAMNDAEFVEFLV